MGPPPEMAQGDYSQPQTAAPQQQYRPLNQGRPGYGHAAPGAIDYAALPPDYPGQQLQQGGIQGGLGVYGGALGQAYAGKGPYVNAPVAQGVPEGTYQQAADILTTASECQEAMNAYFAQASQALAYGDIEGFARALLAAGAAMSLLAAELGYELVPQQ